MTAAAPDPSRSGSSEEDDSFDDLPQTHLDDDAYDEFVQRELGRDGRPRRGPPVTVVILLLLVLVLAVAVVVLR